MGQIVAKTIRSAPRKAITERHPMDQIQEILIDKIKVVENHRTNIDSTHLNELMLSIKQHGLQQPIGVAVKKDHYVLLFGHRRLVACKKLGWIKIMASVVKDVNDEKHLIINLTENMQRKDPSFAELGRIIDKLQSKQFNLSTKEVAARLGLPEGKIRDVVKVYEGLPAKFRSKVTFMEKGGGRKTRKGMIPANVATKIVSLKKDHGLKDKAVEEIFNHVQENGADGEDLENLGIMINHGMSAKDAIHHLHEFKVYAFHFCAAIEEINHLMTGMNIYSAQELFRRIIYGEAPTLKRPAFLKAQGPTKGRVIKAVQTVELKKNWKRFAAMRTSLMVNARMKKLSDEQILALKPTGSVPARDWTPEQCKQIEEIYNTVGLS